MVAHVNLNWYAALFCTELFTPDGKIDSKYALVTTAVLRMRGQQNAVMPDGGREAPGRKLDLTYIEIEKISNCLKPYIAFYYRPELF